MAIVAGNPIEGVLEHITIVEYIDTNTNVVRMRVLTAHTGYAIFDKTQNTGVDPETGEPYPPTYCYSINLAPATPIGNYEAKLIDETMEVVGGKPSTEVS